MIMTLYVFRPLQRTISTKQVSVHDLSLIRAAFSNTSSIVAELSASQCKYNPVASILREMNGNISSNPEMMMPPSSDLLV
jgi:hypothetical protein